VHVATAVLTVPSSHSSENAMPTERDLAPVDRDELIALFNRPGVRRYLLDDELVSIEWVDEMIQKSLQLFTSAGYGLWAARPKELTDIIGFAGFGYLHEPSELQLLYGLHPANWGQGLATEAARAVVGHAFDYLGFDEEESGSEVIVITIGICLCLCLFGYAPCPVKTGHSMAPFRRTIQIRSFSNIMRATQTYQSVDLVGSPPPQTEHMEPCQLGAQ
jgi:hypothetical protein